MSIAAKSYESIKLFQLKIDSRVLLATQINIVTSDLNFQQMPECFKRSNNQVDLTTLISLITIRSNILHVR